MAEPLAAQLEALVASPREDLGVEIKSWLDLTNKDDCATLAKTIIALANHGGGFIILGMRETEAGKFEEAPGRPVILAGYKQDIIAGIAATYAEPAIQVGVYQVNGGAGVYPVVQVPGGHRTPIQAKKGSPDQKTLLVGRVYIRRPKPESAEPGTAAEWRELIDQCVRASRDDLLDAIRGILDGRETQSLPLPPSEEARLAAWADDGLERWIARAPISPTMVKLLPLGFYRVAYKLVGQTTPIEAPDLLEAVNSATTRHTGWSPFWVPTREGIKPYVKDGAVECFIAAEDARRMVDDPAHADFWRVSPIGEAVLIRGFDEDSYPERMKPGTVFDVTLPVWRIGDCLLQAARFAAAIGRPDAEIVFSVKWSGLAGRSLTHVEGRRLIDEGYVSQQDTLDRVTTVRATQVAVSLPEILFEFLKPLYALFDFFQLSKRLVDEEAQRLRQGRF
ncbi:AlbA family DNA-binding domain-containing protein [Xanthobacter autotrophicus]|uniref:AlbA family DNA-binding domain-containing protein n=1 Tax=Xanthobacter autotrophicus TaxID=280 RepID=UPI00372B3662